MAVLADEEWPFGFQSPADAEQLRLAAFARANISMPAPWAPGNANVPKTITFVTAASGESVVNQVRWHCT